MDRRLVLLVAVGSAAVGVGGRVAPEVAVVGVGFGASLVGRTGAGLSIQIQYGVPMTELSTGWQGGY